MGMQGRTIGSSWRAGGGFMEEVSFHLLFREGNKNCMCKALKYGNAEPEWRVVAPAVCWEGSTRK